MRVTILHLLGLDRKVTTYTVGLLQAKAYRVLKQATYRELKKVDLTPLEWSFLGLLNDQPNGMKAKELAAILGVEPPFITVMVHHLSSKKLVNSHVDLDDKRAKFLTLSAEGKRQMPLIEADLRQATNHYVKGVTKLEMIAYLKVLNTIVKNHSESLAD